MGSHVSRLIDSTPFAEYVLQIIPILPRHPGDAPAFNLPNIVQPQLYIGPTTLHQRFHSSDGQRGVFTDDFIPKGTFITPSNLISLSNDGVMNLQPLMDANTSREVFESWHQVYNSYHNFDIITQQINIRAVNFENGTCYEVLQDIPAGGELLRYYGIASWFLIGMLMLSTRATIAGHVKFFEVARSQCHIAYQPWIQKYIDWILPHLAPQIVLPYTDPHYLEAYDRYYATVYFTESMESILLQSIPPELKSSDSNLHIYR